MEVTEIKKGNPFYEVAIDLRYSEFFKPYSLPKEVAVDEMESDSYHFIVTETDSLLAYGRLSPLEPSVFRISQVVVNPEAQGRGLSTVLLNRLVDEAKLRGAKTIRLGAQVDAKQIYEKLGFVAVSDVYTVELTGIPHVKMVYEVDT
ncbi:MAG: GNAT family N-acetyltransferase [Pseudomonadales bacterium]|nr:GNAT family N-acetyltransferase [Pseudomonadales bacterium]